MKSQNLHCFVPGFLCLALFVRFAQEVACRCHRLFSWLCLFQGTMFIHAFPFHLNGHSVVPDSWQLCIVLPTCLCADLVGHVHSFGTTESEDTHMLTPGDPKFPTSCRGEFCVKSSSAQQPVACDAVDSCLRFAWQAPHCVTLGPPPPLPVPASELHQSKAPA